MTENVQYIFCRWLESNRGPLKNNRCTNWATTTALVCFLMDHHRLLFGLVIVLSNTNTILQIILLPYICCCCGVKLKILRSWASTRPELQPKSVCLHWMGWLDYRWRWPIGRIHGLIYFIFVFSIPIRIYFPNFLLPHWFFPASRQSRHNASSSIRCWPPSFESHSP